MVPLSRKPVYNLKAVLQETGLKADTLRAWERRYGLPLPQRTPGGHRLYSQHDIALIRWLLARQAEGLSIRAAVNLWHQQVAGGGDPLGEGIEAAPAYAGATLDALRAAWMNACLQFDENAAEQALNQAFSLHGVEAVCREVMQRGLSELGERWLAGQVSVQQEHFASALAMRRLDALLAAAPPPTQEGALLVACPAGEWHTFSALLMTLLLRRRGWNVIYLGANVPAARLEETVATIRPALVILSAQHLVGAAALAQTARQLQQAGFQMAYGGRIFNRLPGLRTRIPAHFLAEALDDSLAAAERLVRQPVPPPQVAPAPEELRACLQAFQSARPMIEYDLQARLSARGLPADQIEGANRYFGDGLTAALELGDPAWLQSDLDWLGELLGARKIERGRLETYLQLYAAAVRERLGPAGTPIASWIHAQLNLP